MKQSILKSFGVLLALGLVSPVMAGQSGYRPGGLGGPGEVPTPFRTANQKVELAPGERYHLVGWIKVMNGAPYFEIDFSEHSWLQNAARAQWPFYALEGTIADFRILEGRRVRLFAEAHATILRSRETRSYSYELSLQPMVPVREIR